MIKWDLSRWWKILAGFAAGILAVVGAGKLFGRGGQPRPAPDPAAVDDMLDVMEDHNERRDAADDQLVDDLRDPDGRYRRLSDRARRRRAGQGSGESG